MEVAVAAAAAAAGRALRRAGGKGAADAASRAPGSGAERAARPAGQCPVRAVARRTGPRAEVRLPRAPVAGGAPWSPWHGRGDSDTRGTGVGSVGLAQAAWLFWHGSRRTHHHLGAMVAAQV